LEILTKLAPNITEMLLVGGGSKSPFWRQMFSDIFTMDIIKSTVDQDCASLGAAALAAYGLGYWTDYSPIDSVHRQAAIHKPNSENILLYKTFYDLHRYTAHFMSETGNALHKIGY